MNADSFSLNNDAQDELQDSPNFQPVPKKIVPRHDSPIFGFSQKAEPNEQRPFLTENEAFSIDKEVFYSQFNQSEELIINTADERTALLEKVKQTYYAINQQADEQKTRLDQTESMSKKLKHQLVFTKIETNLVRLGQLLKNRESSNTITGFNAIRAEASHRNFMLKYKTQTIYKDLFSKIKLLVRALETFKKRHLRRSFRELSIHVRLDEVLKANKQENEKIQRSFHESVVQIDKERNTALKRIEELNSTVNSLKAKEAELNAIINQKEKQIKTLETEKTYFDSKYAVSSRKNTGHGDDRNNFQQNQAQHKEMQQDPDDLKERLNSSEFSVSSFIKEMNDVLDSHELSTNIGSENNSDIFNNPNHNEAYEPSWDVDNIPKPNERTTPALENSKKPLESLTQNRTAMLKGSINQLKSPANKY